MENQIKTKPVYLKPCLSCWDRANALDLTHTKVTAGLGSLKGTKKGEEVGAVIGKKRERKSISG